MHLQIWLKFLTTEVNVKIAVAGRTQSGKTTALQILQSRFPDMILLESPDISTLANYTDSDAIIFVDTPAFLCFRNAKLSGFIDSTTSFVSFHDKFLKRQEQFFSYVQELNSVFIIKNNKDIANLKVQIHKLKIS